MKGERSKLAVSTPEAVDKLLSFLRKQSVEIQEGNEWFTLQSFEHFEKQAIQVVIRVFEAIGYIEAKIALDELLVERKTGSGRIYAYRITAGALEELSNRRTNVPEKKKTSK